MTYSQVKSAKYDFTCNSYAWIWICTNRRDVCSHCGFYNQKLSCSVYPPGVTLTARLHTARSEQMLSVLNSVASCSAVWETGEGSDWRQCCSFKGRVGCIRTAYYSFTENVKRRRTGLVEPTQPCENKSNHLVILKPGEEPKTLNIFFFIAIVPLKAGSFNHLFITLKATVLLY